MAQSCIKEEATRRWALYGNLDGSESPLISLKQSGKLSGKLIQFMEKAEYLASLDWLDRRLRKDVLAMALNDRWLDGADTIPEIISDTLRQFVVENKLTSSRSPKSFRPRRSLTRHFLPPVKPIPDPIR